MKRLLRATEILAWARVFRLRGAGARAALLGAARHRALPRATSSPRCRAASACRCTSARIEAGWLGLRPQITLSDVRIHDAQGREALVLPSMRQRGRLALAAARRAAPAPARHRRAAPRRAARRRRRPVCRRPQARAQAAAAAAASAAGCSGRARSWCATPRSSGATSCAARRRSRCRRSTCACVSSGTLALARPDGAAAGRARQQPRAARADRRRRGCRRAGWNGRVFAQVGYTDLAAWRAWVDYPFNVRQGQGALRVWVERGAAAR